MADEIYRLRELKQNALAENAEREGKRQRIAEMTDFFNEQSCELEEYDEQLVRRLIEKVTVFHDKFAVEFKSGVEIDVEGESSIMKLATLLYSKKIVSLSLSKPVISFDNRLEAVRLSCQG